MRPDPLVSLQGSCRRHRGSPNVRGRLLAFASVLPLLGLGSAVAQTPNPMFGVWFDDTGRGAVEIRDCGTSVCGRIVWLKEPNDRSGRPLMDAYNPEPTRRTRPFCGLQVLGELQLQPDGSWDAGWIYDPKVGKSYSVAVQIEDRNTLVVTGYRGIKLLGKSFAWTRAPGDLPRCLLAKEAGAPPPPAPTPAQRRP